MKDFKDTTVAIITVFMLFVLAASLAYVGECIRAKMYAKAVVEQLNLQKR